ncbi:putative ubiquitin carboxyl-terminal hydrolase 51 [Iris pallida]|uniref:Ubiquitin carboxyl-terminal hydrolase 51 n=1 Tax=Iris pallida TaxID=29817 RepID=A0AAX6FAQ3_IRIPA|nr:putative ubiquitin carboxyl-terminal hydrolase 51 [Iris pallida]
MVTNAENPSPPPDPMAAAAAAPARSLHNFSSFPILNTWGHRKVLRCLNVNHKGETIRSSSPPSLLPAQPPAQASSSSESPSTPRSEEEEADDESLDRLRDKLFGHYQKAVHHINLVSRSPARTAPEPPPWNLRKRRAAPARDPSLSPPPRPPTRARPPSEVAGGHARTVRLRSEAVERKEEPPRPRFSISLSAREIDEDIYALTGSRARRRPRKRPRAVQKHLDMVSPAHG